MDDAPVDVNELFAAPGLSVVFPAFNEEEGLERTIDAALEAGAALLAAREILDFEIVVVDDASTDATREVADRMARKHDQVRVVGHDRNRGLGAAVRTGFGAARGSWVLYTDADLPFDLLELGRAFRMARHHHADVVAAYRTSRAGEGTRRFVYSYAYNSLVRAVLGLRVRDVNFAGKLMRRSVLDDVVLRSEGSFIDAELLAKADAAGFRIVQIGVDYFPRTRGVSTLSSAGVIVRMLREMAAILPEIRSGRRAVVSGPRA